MSETLIINWAAHELAPQPNRPGGLLPRTFRLSRRGRKLVKRRGAEPYDALLWRLQSRRDQNAVDAALIGVTGCESRTGATTIAANLAFCAAELGLGPVLLVETDAQKPQFGRRWGLPAGPGMAEIALGAATLSDCICNGPAPGLHVVPGAERPAAGAAAWDPSAISALLVEAAADHSLVLFDLPAADRMHQSLPLARRLDQVLLVVRAERTRARYVQRVAEQLQEDGVPLTGAILNRFRRYAPRWLSPES
jgi:tyrosine-protein kinase Etk/Wzc